MKGMRWPIAGSAAGHLLVLACGILLMGSPAAGPLAGVVEVDLTRWASSAPVVSRGSAAQVAPVASALFPPVPPEQALPVEAEATGGVAPVPEHVEARKNAVIAPAAETVVATSVAAETRQRFQERSGPPAGNVLAALPRPDAGGGAAWVGGGDVRRLRDLIESRMLYPEEAVRRGQEGTVILRILVAEGGIPGEVRIARSSGARILDDAARTGVVRAAPLPSAPGWFEVPVRFILH
jgi:protein TonB